MVDISDKSYIYLIVNDLGNDIIRGSCRELVMDVRKMLFQQRNHFRNSVIGYGGRAAYAQLFG
ncbi:hypothetical protein D3C78_1844770 [compost metagenome]